MTVGHIAIDVTDATFDTAVIEQSMTRPVVVDFWAPWCGPCRVLGPAIERVAASFGGDVVLAKVNVDENQRVSMQYRVQGIPAVKAFKDGRVVDEFTGALPESQVRAFFERLVPSPIDLKLRDAEQRIQQGDQAGAESLYREVLESVPDHTQAVIGLARLLVQRAEFDEADSLLQRVPAERRAKVLRHRIFLDRYAARHADEDLQAEATVNPRDARARYRWGVMLAAREQYREALDELLASVSADRNFETDAARKAMLAVFEILGMDSELTREYQRKLENVLF
ncbi:MAG TPA: thioredoxin [Thermomicrobiales bacterium]|nr:thioredoxin [Thermomicrobiales bacterium]